MDFINITCQSDEVTLDVSICQGDSYQFNGMSYTQAGTYTSNQTNMQGCDSLVTLNLSLEQINNTISANGLVINSSLPGLQYQWINCTTLGAIPAATSANYTATQNGTYAVVTTNSNGCTDTSNCISITNVGMNELSSASFTVYPNPVVNQLTISFESVFMGEITITDMSGKLIYEMSSNNKKEINININSPKGIYFVNASDQNGIKTVRIIKL